MCVSVSVCVSVTYCLILWWAHGPSRAIFSHPKVIACGKLCKITLVFGFVSVHCVHGQIKLNIRVHGYSGADPGGSSVPWNPPFERASLTRDTLIEQSQYS